MGLVNELQCSVEKDDVITVLRKTKRMCYKLGRNDILQWVNNEINGYDKTPIPEYRNITAYPGYKLNNFRDGHNGVVLLNETTTLFEGIKDTINKPMSHIVDIIESFNNGQKCCFLMNDKAADTIRRFFANSPDNAPILRNAQFLTVLDSIEIKSIPEQVKDIVLDWACNLESLGIAGDDKSFTNDEKDKARETVFNITHCSVGQISDSGTNLLRK